MARIKPLPEQVANQISAGEVIERPASVVKELMENSIDAASKEIIIEVEDGGRSKIRVKDDGFGIHGDDLELAFARYATSKIEKINDLYALKTLGFRGEALASIASVSRVELRSKAKGELSGYYLQLEGGQIIKKEAIGFPQGTDIIIRDLFYNTPARFKYLKTINTEFAHISNIVNREAIAYPEIKFSLSHNQRKLFQTPGNGQMLDSIYAIYGQEMVDNLIPLNYEDRYIQLTGYIARPSYYRSSRIHQVFMVNKRVVYSRELSKGVEQGYQGLLPPGTYPIVFINLKLNQILVDVNVHPSKREVKFSRGEIIQKVIAQGVKKNLEENNPSPRVKIEKISSHQPWQLNNTSKQKQNLSLIPNIYTIERKKEEIKERALPFENTPLVKEKPVSASKNSGEERKKLRILGQIHRTYIIAAGEDGLIIIDQHNAHERIIYDQLRQKYSQRKVKSQSLLVPLNIELSLPEMEIVKKYAPALELLGIKLEPFGSNSLIIQEVPSIIKNKNSKQVLRELIDQLLQEGKTMEEADLIDEILTYLSCRSAIKAGKILSLSEMEELSLKLLASTNPYRCPHGRPIIIHLSEEDIAKGLGRR